MRLVLATFGSRGDVQPFVVLGHALVRAGHDVVLCAPDDFAGMAGGLPFQALAHDFESQLSETGGRLERMLGFMRTAIEQQLEILPRVVEGAQALVVASAVAAGPSVAEALGIPYHYVSFCPRVQPSRYHPTLAIPINRLPQWLNRFSWWLNERIWSRIGREPLEAWRARAGLRPSGELFRETVTEQPLLAADPLLAPLPPDLSAGTRQVGAFFLDDPQPLPAEVESFLAAGEPPVYIGFGSMVDPEPARTTRELVAGVRAAGVRAILSRGWAGLGADPLPPEVLAIGSVSHWALLPRVRAVVHHGGAGTTHAAVRAGVPQVVVPHILDQFYWSERMYQLGVAPAAFSRKRLEARRLAEALRWCLRPEPLQQARELAAGLRTDGVERAVALLTAPSEPLQRRATG
jgi:vancomycin aglycone glucosyltransferase